VLVQDGADGGCGPGGVPVVPGGPADRPVGDHALVLFRVAFATAVGQAVPQHAADVLVVIQPDAQFAASPAGQPGLQFGAGLRVAPQQLLRDAVLPRQLADVGLGERGLRGHVGRPLAGPQAASTEAVTAWWDCSCIAGPEYLIKQTGVEELMLTT